jgi:acyl-coenzyme A thioesterase PaaI-like protein
MPTPLDRLRQVVDGSRPSPPIATLIGFTLSAVSPGEAVIELEAGRRHANPMGTLHGGVLCDIADAAMGVAYASTLAG